MPKVKGGKDGRNYMASFDGRSQSKKVESANSKDCILLISVQGNKYCTEKWFKSALEGAIKKFSRVTLLIVDKLNEYNLKSNLDSYENDFIDNKYKRKASILGFNWLIENLSSFFYLLTDSQKNKILAKNYLSEEKSDSERIKIFYKLIALLNRFLEKNDRKFEIFTWDQWISGEEDNLLKLNNHILKVKPIYEAISRTAFNYVKRHSKKNLDLSKLYLIGETVGLIYLAMKRKHEMICYPGDCPEPFEKFIHQINNSTKLSNILKELQSTNLEWLHINFENVDKYSVLQSPDTILKETCNNLISSGFTPQMVGQALLNLSKTLLTTKETREKSTKHPTLFSNKREDATAHNHLEIRNTCITAK